MLNCKNLKLNNSLNLKSMKLKKLTKELILLELKKLLKDILIIHLMSWRMMISINYQFLISIKIQIINIEEYSLVVMKCTF